MKELGREDFSKIPNGLPGWSTAPPHVPLRGGPGPDDGERPGPAPLGKPRQALRHVAPKGCLAVGSDADVVIFDPARTWTITAKDQVQAVDYTPYEA